MSLSHESWSEFTFWKELGQEERVSGSLFPWKTDEEVVELEMKSTRPQLHAN